MLATGPCPRKRSTRNPFRSAPWDEHHPDLLRIDAQLPPQHHVRWLKEAVARLDLSPLRRLYANRGSLAYPPEQLLPFVLYLHADKQTSPARWADAARDNDACKWLLLGLRPSRSQLYTFRDRVEPFLEPWHRQLIDWAKAEGITSGQRGSLDGSFVAALASRHRLLSPGVVDGRVLLLVLAVWVAAQFDKVVLLLGLLLALLSWLVEDWLLGLLVLLLLLVQLHLAPQTVRRGVLPAWLPQSTAGRVRLLRRLEIAQQRQHERIEPLLGKKRLSKKDKKALQAKINPSDPEAALGFDKLGTFRPLYNLLLVKATDANLILAWELFSRNNDDGLLWPLMEQTFKQLGHYLAEVLVDGAFVSIGDLLRCEAQGIIVYAPLDQEVQTRPALPAPAEPAKASAAGPSGSVAASRAASPPRAGLAQPQSKTQPRRGAAAGKGKAAKKYGKEKFRYDEAKKQYHCPAGKVLKEVYRTSEKRSGGMELTVLVHRAEASDCQQCAQRSQCTRGKQGRVVKRYEGEEVLDRLRQRMAEPANQKIYRLRSQSVEPGYGELKEQRGLHEFRCFGKPRSRVQAGLTILANNALSIVRALRRRDAATPTPPTDDL